MRTRTTIPLAAAVALLSARTMTASAAESYEHFGAAIYARAYEVREMGDLEKLRTRFDLIGRQVKVSKIYLETHRDKVLVDADTQALDVRMDGPAEVSLFLYDNGTLVVESFRDEATEVSLVLNRGKAVRDLETGETLRGQAIPEGQGFFRSPDAGRSVVKVPVKPHSYRAFIRE